MALLPPQLHLRLLLACCYLCYLSTGLAPPAAWPVTQKEEETTPTVLPSLADDRRAPPSGSSSSAHRSSSGGGAVIASEQQSSPERPRSPGKRCVYVRIGECSKLYGSNFTALPNRLGHRSGRVAARSFAALRPALNASCSGDLLRVACALLAQDCPLGEDSSAPRAAGESEGPRAAALRGGRQGTAPCRDTCRKVRRECAGQLQDSWLSWSACDLLPAKSSPTYPCYSPSVPMKGGPVTKLSKRLFINRLSDCKCKKKQKFGKKVYINSLFHYSIKGTFRSVQGIEGGPQVITVHVEDILKASRVQIPNNTDLTLWAGKGCVCPKLKAGHKYVFVGYEDAYNKRLLFDRNSIALRWKHSWRQLVAKWEERVQRKLARERRRRHKKRQHSMRDIFEPGRKPRRRQGRYRALRQRGRKTPREGAV